MLFNPDTTIQSKAFEGLLVNQLNAEYFWRDSYKNEVDIILDDQKLRPIEIKYGKIETEGLLRFMEKYHVNEGYIISNHLEKTYEINGKKILITPAYKYLLQ
jgi:predicted AAA+ superfamily ATPase